MLAAIGGVASRVKKHVAQAFVVRADQLEWFRAHPGTPHEALDMACDCMCHFGDPMCDNANCAAFRGAIAGSSGAPALPILQDEGAKAQETVYVLVQSESHSPGKPVRQPRKKAATPAPAPAPVAEQPEVVQPAPESGHKPRIVARIASKPTVALAASSKVASSGKVAYRIRRA